MFSLVLMAGLVAQPNVGPSFDVAARVWAIDAGDGCYWLGPTNVVCVLEDSVMKWQEAADLGDFDLALDLYLEQVGGDAYLAGLTIRAYMTANLNGS